MQHATFAVKTTATDQELGQFEALVSGWTEDREGDTITPGAFDRTIDAWQRSQKRLPLLFEHSVTAVGAIFPESMRTTEEGLVVSGEVDRDTDEGRQVWSMIKNSTCSFSIGFMSESRKREGGGREIYEIDLLEISATATPAHASTRTISWKSATATEPTEQLTAEEQATLDRVRAEWQAKREAEAAEEEEEETPLFRHQLHHTQPPHPDARLNICGVHGMLARNVTINGKPL